MKRLMVVIVALALAGCIGPPLEPDSCITKEDVLPGAITNNGQGIPPEQVESFEDAGFVCYPYEVDYCAGQCVNGMCPEPGIYSYQCMKE